MSSLKQDLSRVVGADLLLNASRKESLPTFLAQLILFTLWKGLTTVGAPLGRVLAMWIWAGRTGNSLGHFTQQQLLTCLGWLNGPAVGHRRRLARMIKNMVGLDLKRWHVAAASLASSAVLTAVVQKWRERHDAVAMERQRLHAEMLKARDYKEWTALVNTLNGLDGAHLPTHTRQQRRTRLYDEKLLREKTEHLQAVHRAGLAREMMFALRIDLIRNIANVAKSQVPGESLRVPDTISSYLNEVREQLLALAEWPEHELPAEEKLAFFKQTRLAYGRTALLLGGGGGLGTFHIGVIKALFEHKMLPRVLAGSSVGSIVCAMVCTKTDHELHVLLGGLESFEILLFNNVDTWSMSRHFLHKGSLQDIGYLIKQLRTLLGDLTFLEAYERTGRILNVTVCPADTNEPPRLLNYCTAPQALIWSAVAASSAFPGLFPAQNIVARNSEGRVVMFSQHSTNDTLERRWRDGSLELDLPVQALSEMFQCNHFLVSQTNPHIVPLLNIKKMFPRNLGKIMEAELKHRCQVLQWMLPDWVPSKWLTLFTQPWEGDITMTLPPELWHLGRTIRNPTSHELNKAVKIGERSTWENLSSIECNCTIEATLDSCVAKITNRVRSTPLRGLGKSLPSWLHMTSVGVPSVASWGDNVGLPTPSSTGSSLHGGSLHGGSSIGASDSIFGHTDMAEEELGDSASEQVPHRRRSLSSFPGAGDHQGQGQGASTSTSHLPGAGGGSSPLRAHSSSHHAPLPSPNAAAGSGQNGGSPGSPLGNGGVHWEFSSDDGMDMGGSFDGGAAGGGRRSRGRSSAGLRRLSSSNATRHLNLSASVLDMATMDCTDTSVDGSGQHGIWGAMFGAASSSTLAGGPQHNGFGMDMLQY